ncbi:DUF459 domain-containing protein [Snodgrassella communis]|uniref:SGNH/GDSL hydrolase family protein n=1 Tax=Snodgrassella communis TaxID=2946699 RepID=UPI001EF74C58|nr:SGNH family hydrolase [Snodgrassella communis]
MPTSKYRRLHSYQNYNQQKKYSQFNQIPVVTLKTVTTLPMVVASEEPKTEIQVVKSNKQQFRFVLLTLMITASISLWLMQDSVTAYYHQTYHQNSFLIKLKQQTWWQKGAQIGMMLNDSVVRINQNIATVNHDIITAFNKHYVYAHRDKVRLQQQANLAEQQRQQTLQKTARGNSIKTAFTLSSNDVVFFAGDSLMQGVAPHVQKWLSNDHGIKTINLSKQSTGLTYSSFFNWPQTIERTLDNNPHIKIMVMFLGPNDPWDVPDPQNGSRFISFASAQWESMYRSRIKTIMDTARQHQVTVLWLTPPDMRRNKLNEQMVYLRKLITDEVSKNHGYIMDTRVMLGSIGGKFNDTITEADGKKIKTRSPDGIHFTVSGQKIIAKNIFNRFNLPPQSVKNDTLNGH